MIIFLSDLHLSDGTAGPPNLRARTFANTFHRLGQAAHRADSPSTKIVFLGDIFDLVRTSSWRSVDEQQRPWGSTPNDGAIAALVERIASTEENRAIFDVLGGDLMRFGFPADTERVYVTGNHDRSMNTSPMLRQKAVDLLGLMPVSKFPSYFYDEAHRVFARHGHEFDPFNFDRAGSFEFCPSLSPTPEEYDLPAVGDAIACEFASNLPGFVMARLGVTETDPGPHSELLQRLRELFDLRPLSAIPQFLAHHMRRFDCDGIGEKIMAGVRDAVDWFEAVPFVQRWLSAHASMSPVDQADQVQALIAGLRHLTFDLMRHSSSLLGTVGSSGDNLLSNAVKDFKRLQLAGMPARFVLYGHTHEPDQIPITASESLGGSTMYLNTGMWRPAQHQATQTGYTRLEHLTTTIIYQPGDRLDDRGPTAEYPTFETWTGTQSS